MPIFGISCFSIHKPLAQSIQISNKTYNFLTYADEFQVEAKSLKFLVDHGFDLNRLFRHGLRHYRGNDKSPDIGQQQQHSIRSVLNQMTRAKTPIVLHNGFIDLVFLYQNFYADLPDVSMKFLADLAEIFSGGIFDTKYISEFHVHSSASFLEYLYKKALYENTQAKAKINVKFPSLDGHKSVQLSDFHHAKKNASTVEKKICHNYSTYGYCSRIETCNKSHDVNEIIQAELSRKKPKKLPTLEEQQQQPQPAENEISSLDSVPQRESTNQAHSAGLDSFMTGYVLLNFMNKLTNLKLTDKSAATAAEAAVNETRLHLMDDFDLDLFRNKVYLTGKDYPLMVVKSNFATTSANHKEKQKNCSNNNY